MRTVLLIAPNFSEKMGGEAIKALQFARHLKASGRPFKLICHRRSVKSLIAEFPAQDFDIIEDSRFQVLLSKLPVLQFFLNVLFFAHVSRHIRRRYQSQNVILHYVTPISPVALRLPPTGFDAVMGPLSGNIFFPPGFEKRSGWLRWLLWRSHAFRQKTFGVFFHEKRKAAALLVSGYERTKASLRIAGARDDQFVDVVDSGVNPAFFQAPRLRQTGVNHHFVSIGRLDAYKGYDLAIRAVAKADPQTTLDIFGSGGIAEELQALAASLGVGDRVRFKGHIDNKHLPEAAATYRGFVFPTLAEANGIVMQEMMALGLPVITMSWGGPVGLADDRSAEFVEPASEQQIIAELAARMDKLAKNSEAADGISDAARQIAEARFRWDDVAASWMAAYPD